MDLVKEEQGKERSCKGGRCPRVICNDSMYRQSCSVAGAKTRLPAYLSIAVVLFRHSRWCRRIVWLPLVGCRLVVHVVVLVLSVALHITILIARQEISSIVSWCEGGIAELEMRPSGMLCQRTRVTKGFTSGVSRPVASSRTLAFERRDTLVIGPGSVHP